LPTDGHTRAQEGRTQATTRTNKDAAGVRNCSKRH